MCCIIVKSVLEIGIFKIKIGMIKEINVIFLNFIMDNMEIIKFKKSVLVLFMKIFVGLKL